jgi:hypothetical protein
MIANCIAAQFQGKLPFLVDYLVVGGGAAGGADLGGGR